MPHVLRQMSLRAAVVATAPVVALVTGAGGATAAAPTCDSADFTVGGVFDLDGYLACLAGGAPGAGAGAGGGGTLPTTGSDVVRLVALGVGVTVVGIGALVSAKRRPVAATEPDALAV